jgi:riboflavin kinase/FMN adenylyltransferase
VELIRQPRELETRGRKVCLAIGMFDGVHLGHQQVIRQTILDARQHNGLAIAITFDRHPNSIVAPERTPPLIYSLEQKLREISKLGVDAILLLEFTREFSQKAAEQFVQELSEDFRNIYSICVGSNFTFGCRRSGNVDLLKRMGQELGFRVHGLSAVALDGQVVSSTRIRDAIRAGDLDSAAEMLGRGYSLASKIIHGDQMGTKLGFPTANLDSRGLLTPPNGVYIVEAEVEGKTYPAVANIGVRPTLKDGSSQVRVEVHLLDFNEDLYEKEMEIFFLEPVRGEQKFASLEALKEQISKDVQAARKFFENGK